MNQPPDIFTYIDFRRWLADVSEHRKATTRYFSHRWFAQAAGITNPSVYSQVVSGKRKLTPSMLEAFARVLELSERETLFFRHLVGFTQADSALVKEEHYAVMRTLAGSVRQTTVGADSWDFYRHWWVPALRELVAQSGGVADPARLAARLRPKITTRQAREGIDLLVRLGMLEQDESGLWRQTSRALTSGDDVRALAIRRHNAQMAHLGEEAIERFTPDVRHITGITAGLSPAAYRILVAEIQGFRDRVVRLVDQDDAPGEVYQINVQLFPLSAGEDA